MTLHSVGAGTPEALDLYIGGIVEPKVCELWRACFPSFAAGHFGVVGVAEYVQQCLVG